MLKKHFKRIQKAKRSSYKIRKHNKSSLPRLVINKTNCNFYAQLIDDSARVTLASVNSLKITDKLSGIEIAKHLGEEIGKKISQQSISNIVFDRRGYLYHGRVKAFADAVREQGVQF